ncbi:hypothetical protein [Achromobacter xylosoxidans]|uniref:hypothetical protein n=1 Tax=Alcaligenes xylosoxydans xylosoxydans TaxID=85698 RepID=UPI001F0EB535|nr:hypothetical protein [Achromobacter xylosoxidans]MCH4576208.1 hypothetical protein [Achromobacter xylosoxidans]
MNENNAAKAVQEAERIAAADEYFQARTWIMDTNDNRRIFEAGFDRAYALLSKLRAPVSSIREGFELTYAADADDPACASDLSHFTNGWRACVMSQVGKPAVVKLEVDAAAAIARINDEVARLRAPVADERAAFEAWALTEFTHPFMVPDPLIEDPDGSGDYVNRDVQMAWAGFQQACAALASAPVAGEPFMYGIMGPDGKAHFEEFCVSGDRSELQTEVVDHLNRDNPEGGTYSVVALFRDAAPQASPRDFAKLQSAYVGACDQIAKLLAEKQASAEPLVRYCPGCGSVGPVGDEYRDCCPDGGEARIIPAPLAEKCRDTFKIAVKALRADAAANEAMANQVPAVTEEYTLRAMARNYTDRHSWDKLDSKAITAAADEIRALRAALAARALIPERGDAHD